MTALRVGSGASRRSSAPGLASSFSRFSSQGRGSLSPIEGPIFPMYYPASSLDKELGLISCRTIASFAGDDCSHSEDSVFGTAGLFGTAPQYQEHQNGRKRLKNELQ